MKRALFILAFLSLSMATLFSQVTKEQLKGVWGIVAMRKIGHDTAIILDRDSVIAGLFTDLVFEHISDKINGAKTANESMNYTILGMFSNMFLQFDEKNGFGEGMKPEMPDQKPSSVKRGTYTLNGNKLVAKTKSEEHFEVEQKGEYLVLTSETGSVMYLKKYSDVLY